MSARGGRGRGRGGRGDHAQPGGGRGRGGGRDSGSGGAARGGGGGRFDSGRGGRGGGRDGGGRDGGGRDGGGRDSGRGGGRGRSEPPCPAEASSNVIPCTVSPSLRFYVYGVEATSKNGKQIDSRSRRGQLYGLGVFDPKVGLLARNYDASCGKKMDDMIAEWRRLLFFQNSVIFAARPLPGMEPLAKQESVPLVGGGKGTPESDNGDAMTVTDLTQYSPPAELIPASASASTAAPRKAGTLEASMASLTVDLRCADCIKSFVDDKALLAHCQMTGHAPVIASGGEGAKPANREVFLQYANVVLKRALGERLAPWGREFIDPKSFTEPQDSRSGKSLGVRVFKAFTCEFGLHKSDPDPNAPCCLGLTVDLRAKVMRTTSLLEVMSGGTHPEKKRYDDREQKDFKRQWCNEVVIATYDKRCYSVKDLLFDKSPATLPVSNKGMSHAEYFAQRKGITLKYPKAVPMVEVLGRNDSSIYLPAEIVCANELDTQLKAKLPLIASFTPDVRHKAIEEIRRFVTPGAQKSKGEKDLLPSLGFVLSDSRVRVRVTKLPLPVITAAGLRIPESAGGMWAPQISKANYKVDPGRAVSLNVILVYHRSLRNYMDVYNIIKRMANDFNSTYRFGERPHQLIEAGDKEQHWGAVEKYFHGRDALANAFILDLSRPPRGQSSDPAYSVVKSYLGKGGYLSQFVNYATYNHDDPRDQKKSQTILSGVARQILSKCGVRIWWVNIPKTVPLPAVFVGVDVFHAPRKFDPKAGKKTAKESVAAVIVSIIRDHEARPNSMVEMYCETEVRSAGQEMKLDTVMNRTVANALKAFKVSPKSCFIWRDGVGDNSIKQVTDQEIPAVKQALQCGVVGGGAAKADVPVAYIVCQKRINTKFLTDKGEKLPCGALVTDLQGPEYKTFYINGTCPPYSTPKPVRFIIAERDPALNNVSPTQLTWALCHDYPNWTGPIKLPAPTQLAHKLAELAGGMSDCGRSINHQRYAGKVYFL